MTRARRSDLKQLNRPATKSPSSYFTAKINHKINSLFEKLIQFNLFQISAWEFLQWALRYNYFVCWKCEDFFNRSCNEFVTQFPAFVEVIVKSAEIDCFLSDGAWASRGAVLLKAEFINVHTFTLYYCCFYVSFMWCVVNATIHFINHT